MLKDQNMKYSLKFKQLVQARPFNPVTGMCRLCLGEKYFIMFKPEGANINNRSEFFAACRHKTRLLLCTTAPPKKARPRPKSPLCPTSFNHLDPICISSSDF